MSTAYVESSALVKLVLSEPESEGLRAALARFTAQAASVISAVEVPRAVARATGESAAREAATSVLGQLALVDLGADVRARAAVLDPPTLRALDAIHLATALSLGDDLDALITYDVCLAEAAEAAGVTVLAPR